MIKEKLGKYIKLVGGGTPSKEIESYWNGDIPWASVKDLKSDYIDTTEDNITQEGVDNSSTKVIQADTLLIATRMAVGKTAFPRMNVAINQDLKAINCSSELDKKYLFYFLKSRSDYFNYVSTGATVKGIKIDHITSLKIPLPPLAIQKKIAAILDAADALRQKDRELIEKYDELTQSLFLDMFGDPVKNEKGWEKVELKDVCTKITDGTHHSPPIVDKGYPYVTAKHVKSYGLDFNLSPTFVDKEHHDPIYKRCSPEFGDILYIKDGATTGIACINTFKEEFCMLSSLALLKPNYDIVNNYFLCYWLNHDGVKRKLISEYMSGAAIKRYTLKKINSFKVMIPPISLQNQFADRVQAIEQQKQQAQESLKKSEELFQSLLQRAFKGELV